MKELQHLFVYGSLRRAAGTNWSRFLAGKAAFAGNARARGELYRIGSYAGMVSSDADAWVVGEVWRIEDAAALWPALDKYEGCAPDDPLPHEFERGAVTVALDTGETIEACAYLYALPMRGEARIVSGDYLQPEANSRPRQSS